MNDQNLQYQANSGYSVAVTVGTFLGAGSLFAAYKIILWAISLESYYLVCVSLFFIVLTVLIVYYFYICLPYHFVLIDNGIRVRTIWGTFEFEYSQLSSVKKVASTSEIIWAGGIKNVKTQVYYISVKGRFPKSILITAVFDNHQELIKEFNRRRYLS